MKPECDVQGKGTGRGLSPGQTAGVHTWELASGRAGEQREGEGRKSRELVMWSWLEPGLRRVTDQDLNLAITFYNQETAVGNLSALCFIHVLYQMGK